MQICVQAPAKLNLTFDIRGTLPDGYHEVETLLQSVDLADKLAISVQPHCELSFHIQCMGEHIPDSFPLDQTNLIARAAGSFFQAANIRPDYKIDVEIEKIIPIGAGLAGGSADAAAMLFALNQLFDHPLDGNQLKVIGSSLGADVPFCLDGGTQIGRHRGDQLEVLNNEHRLYFCIVKPKKLSVSTPWAYQQYDQFRQPIAKPDTIKAASALCEGRLDEAIDNFGNVFEPVIFAQFSELIALKQQLLKLGSWRCHLSGSGPALYAVVADREMAHFMRRKILKNDDDGFIYIAVESQTLDFFITESTTHGIKVIEVMQ
jgi:4-diphosphocytidyl-2-C-methyl-D-erythritol kinase